MTLCAGREAEVCGLLLGRADRIEAILPAENVASDAARHFELDPAVLIAAYRAARQGGPAVLGHYHSHPSGVAEPSMTDAENSAPDGSLWLIVGGGAARLWRAKPHSAVKARFTEIPLDHE